MGSGKLQELMGFLNFSQVMSRSVTDCKHSVCWNQLIYWTGVKFLKSVHSKTVCFNVHDHIKSAHTPIILHRVLCRSLKKRSVGAPHCIQKRVYNLEIFMWSVRSLGQMLYTKGSFQLVRTVKILIRLRSNPILVCIFPSPVSPNTYWSPN